MKAPELKEVLDAAMLEALKSGPLQATPLMGRVERQAADVAEAIDRPPFRVIDQALQRLKNQGKIAYTSKIGWSLI